MNGALPMLPSCRSEPIPCLTARNQYMGSSLLPYDERQFAMSLRAYDQWAATVGFERTEKRRGSMYDQKSG